MNKSNLIKSAVVFAGLFVAAPGVLRAQIPFEQALKELSSPDEGTRLHAVQLLKQAAFEEAAVPLAPLIGDPKDSVQLEAIGAELNIFLADKVVGKKRKALVVEVRNAVLAESAFSVGPLALGGRAVPHEVLDALLKATHDNTPRVGLEALYAYGTLAIEPGGPERNALLAASAPSLVTFLGSTDPAMRYAGVRVIGRVFARRASDPVIDPMLGDAVITALNDSDRVVKAAAMAALGAMRYDRGVQALTDLFQFFAKGPLAEASLDALAHIASPASIPVFSAALTGKNEVFQMMAIEGIARLADASRLTDVQTATAATHSASVQLAAAFAAVMLTNASPDQIGEALTKPKVRTQAKGYLVEIAPGHVAQLSGHLQDPDERVRADVADALGLAGDPAALPMLEPLLTDRDPDVAHAAEHATARLRRR